MNNTDLFSHNQTANNQNYNNKINKLINYEIIQNRYRNYKRKILINKYFIYITLRTIAVRTGNKGIQRYIDLVLSGELYEFIEQELIELDYHPKGRKEVKQIVFLILFSSNKKKSPQEKMFQDIFPEVYGVFTEIKKGEDEGYKDLSVLLQRMESYLFIDVICKRISKEFPEAPIFTCHDSIATTYKYEEDVKRIASEELKKATGNIPILKSEH